MAINHTPLPGTPEYYEWVTKEFTSVGFHHGLKDKGYNPPKQFKDGIIKAYNYGYMQGQDERKKRMLKSLVTGHTYAL